SVPCHSPYNCKTTSIIRPNLGHKKRGRSHETPPLGSAEMAGICRFHHKEGKRLVFSRNKPFYTPFGGDKRDRTADLLNAIQALSQLSYTPIFTCACRTGRPNELYFSRVGRVCQLFFSLF